MRGLFALSVGLISAVAVADRVITVPTGKKIPVNSVRWESYFETRRADGVEWLLAAGLTREIELELVGDRFDRHVRPALNVSYNYIAPFTDMTPGLSVGVRDVMNVTPQGRSPYLAATYRIGLDGDHNQRTPAELTLGVGTGGFRGVFVGFFFPVTDSWRLIGDHDGHTVSGGIEFRPSPELALRFVQQSSRGLIGIQLNQRF
ncbi:MAG: hypothetical protein ACK4XJ_10595 [Fimbriimonadaceae bacterium]